MADDKEADVIDDGDDETKVEEVNDLKMSRTQEPDPLTIDFNKFRDLIVYDSMGNKIRFGDVYKQQKTILFFVRNFLEFITKDYVEDIALIPLEYLQEAGVRLVVIGPAPYKFIKDFRQETGLQHTLYCDPEREVYSALNLHYKTEAAPLNKSKHIKQGLVMGMLRSTWKAMRVQEWQGDIKQQGGTFIFGPGEEVHYSHIDNNSVEHAPLNEVLGAAGVQQVSFPKDPRVQAV